MLYGRRQIQEEILEKVYEFEKKYNKKVIFGAMVGSISKGVERYDSDYDTRFLYLDRDKDEYFRWDRLEKDIEEKQIHKSFVPERSDLFYDKIAFWEFTSFISFLKKPSLDGKFSVGLYHIVVWTFNSPYCWDPYGISNKISCLIDAMFVKSYEVSYYRKYIENCMKKKEPLLREYLYSAYYAIAIQYCIERDKFAPIYFPTILKLCDNQSMEIEIKKLENRYYEETNQLIKENRQGYKRKMSNLICVSKNEIIDSYIEEVLDMSKKYQNTKVVQSDKDYVEDIIDIVIKSLMRPTVKDVN